MKKSSKENHAQLVENWQRCRPEDLPGLFYAYDDVENQGERVVTYRMKPKQVKGLVGDVNPKEAFRFVVHLGVRSKFPSDRIPTTPDFVLLIQVHYKKADWLKKCYEPAWEKNSRFSATLADDTNSGINAIPAASAYLFVQSWLEMPEEELAQPFTAVSHVLGKRVKAYIFSETESRSIYNDMLASIASGKPCVDLHLGSGLAVWQHPFSFRPVIEVKKAVTTPEEPGTIARNATGLLNDDGDSFYDFGTPVPPY